MFFMKFVYVLGKAKIGYFRNFKDQIIEFPTKFQQTYFLWSKIILLQNALVLLGA